MISTSLKNYIKSRIKKTNTKAVNKGKERHRVLKFTMRDIADAKGVTIHAVHMAVRRRLINPEDIKSIARYILAKG